MQFDLEYNGDDRNVALLFEKLKFLFSNIDEDNLNERFEKRIADLEKKVRELEN